MATSFSDGGSWRTTDHGQATGKLYHLRLRVECTLFCNLQSRAPTHAVLVIGLYELLDPATELIEPPRPPCPLENIKIHTCINCTFLILYL
jgi:hypothetical protein